MDKNLILYEIETQFPVNDIRVNGKSFWPFFRLLIFSSLNSGYIQVHKKNRLTPFVKVKNAFFGLLNWRTRWKYIFFSNEMERKTVNGKTFDKLTELAIEKLGFENSLYVELVEKSHLSKRAYGKKAVSSFDFVLVLTAILKLFRNPLYQVKFENENVLRDILLKYKLDINYRLKLSEFLLKVSVLKHLFSYCSPKVVFITDYGNMPVIYAAKQLTGIKVVEFQHGVIGMAHQYYHPKVKLSGDFCPDSLLVFGLYDKESLSSGNYVAHDKVIPVGNFFLDYVKDIPHQQAILDRTKQFDRSVCVPTDRITHEYLLDFVKKVAILLPNVLFIISPRSADLAGGNNLPVNVVVDIKYSFQELVKHCTFNTCTFSTCCLESLTLGIPNILVDRDGRTSACFGTILTDEKTTKFAKSESEYVEFVKNFSAVPVHYIMQSNVRNYVPNYRENLEAALKQITS